jgi:hypothetical protein
LNYTRESYTTLSRNFAAVTLGEELMHKLGVSTVLNEKLYFFPVGREEAERYSADDWAQCLFHALMMHGGELPRNPLVCSVASLNGQAIRLICPKEMSVSERRV